MAARCRCFMMFLFAAVPEARVAGVAQTNSGRINPALEPESDSAFMKKDFPVDHRPTAKELAFRHPYPIVQESNTYDSDYVKDENSDNGEWFAQTEYDRKRQQVRETKRAVAAAERRLAKEKGEYDDAFRNDEEAKKRVESEKAKADRARGRSKSLSDEEEKAKRIAEEEQRRSGDALRHGGMAGNGIKESDVIHEARVRLEKEEVDFEECKKQLEDAKEALKKALAEQRSAAESEQNKKEARKTELAKKIDEDAEKAASLKDRADGAAADAADAEQRASEAQREEEEIGKAAEKQRKEDMTAEEKLVARTKVLKKAEEDLESTENRLRKFRGSREATSEGAGGTRPEKCPKCPEPAPLAGDSVSEPAAHSGARTLSTTSRGALFVTAIAAFRFSA